MDNTKTTKATWTCIGPVRGTCGVKHRTEAAAVRCCDADQRDCRALPGGRSYSDRRPVAN